MADATTIWLDDQSVPGTSAIHTDFLNILAGIYFEPHFTTKGKLGRLMGVLARAVADNNDPSILAVGLDERTGLVIQNDTALVIGIGQAAFMHESPITIRIRDTGRPLVYTDLVSDHLTNGWLYDLAARAPITTTLPPGVTGVTWPGPGTVNANGLTIKGSIETDKTKFQRVAAYYPSNYSLKLTTTSVYVRNGIGFTDAGNSTKRGYKQETLFRALVAQPTHLGVFAFSGDTLARSSLEPDVVSISGTTGAIFIDPQETTFKGLSPYRSNVATSGGSLKAGALTNLRLSALAESGVRGMRYDTRLHQIVP
jgi:hypothetical protein